jgi:membrane protein DedA with SNARE-associated domain
MIILSTISLLVGALLGQRFRVMVLMPATAIVLLIAVGTGATHVYTAWSIILMAVAAATSMQIGYLIGIGVHHVLAAALSRRSPSLVSPTASTPARHSAR